MDDTPDVCICFKFPDTEVLAITKEAHGNGLDFPWSARSTYFLQLVIYLETRVGLSWSSSYSQYFMVAYCCFTIDLHFLYEVGWCLEWIFMVGLSRLVRLCKAIFGLCYYVMVKVCSPVLTSRTYLTFFFLLIFCTWNYFAAWSFGI